MSSINVNDGNYAHVKVYDVRTIMGADVPTESDRLFDAAVPSHTSSTGNAVAPTILNEGRNFMLSPDPAIATTALSGTIVEGPAHPWTSWKILISNNFTLLDPQPNLQGPVSMTHPLPFESETNQNWATEFGEAARRRALELWAPPDPPAVPDANTLILAAKLSEIADAIARQTPATRSEGPGTTDLGADQMDALARILYYLHTASRNHSFITTVIFEGRPTLLLEIQRQTRSTGDESGEGHRQSTGGSVNGTDHAGTEESDGYWRR